MARAITNLIQIGAIAEVTPGTTPATPALQLRRVTGENLLVKRNFTRSEEFNASRSLADQILVNARAEGSIKAEWNDGEFEDFMENALWGAWATDVLVNGQTRKSHSIEVKYEAGATDQWKLFTGMQVEEWSTELVAGEKVTTSFSFQGMNSTFPTSGFAGATYPAAGTEPPQVTSAMSLTSTGLVVDSVTRLTFKVNNNLRLQQVLGSYTPSAIAPGTFDVSGEIELYLNTGVTDHVTAYLANTSFTLLATIGNVTLKKTRLEIPKAKFTDVQVIADGNDQDVMVKGNWVGVYDSGINGTMKVTRNLV